MGKRNKVTTRDIAQATQVSQSTVSMILSGNKNVSFKEETVELVQQKAKELGYKKPSKRIKTSPFKNTIVVLCSNPSNTYYSTVLSRIIQQAYINNTQVYTISTLRNEEVEKNTLLNLKKMNPTGLILLYPPKRIKELKECSKLFPCVIIGDTPDALDFDSIELNSMKCGKLLGNHLNELNHKKIAFISSPMDQKEIGRNERYLGLKQAFQGQVDAYSVTPNEFSQLDIEQREYLNGYTITETLLNKDYTAFIGNNDTTALGIQACLKDHSLKASVAGFDNIPISNHPLIQLTSVDHGANEKGQEAVDLILRKKNNQKHVIHMEYEPQLIVRSSTFKCK